MIDWDSIVLGPLEGVFGEPVEFRPAAGQPFSISGIFDEAYREVDPATGSAFSTVTPVLGVRMIEFPSAPKQGDKLMIPRTGQIFIMKDAPHVDSHGGAKLLLNEVSS